MVNNEPLILELSPSLRERLLKSFIAIVGFIFGVILICGSVLVDLNSTMAQFIAIFIGAITIAFSFYRILRISTQKLYIGAEEIRYRDRFLWQRVSWSEVISIGRANDIETKENDSVIKKIKSLILLTNSGVKQFDMSTYSLTHGIETMNKITDYRLKDSDIIEEEEEEIESYDE